MASRSRRRLTAWLGFIAMWLIVLAPLVSQLVVAAHTDDPTVATLCSASQPSHSVADAVHGDPLAACGYCDLLADHVALSTLSPSSLVFVMLAIVAAVPILSMRFTPLWAFPSGRPRAPPSFS
ncbi:DUF2946 domain-containing protein [Caballeronia sp. DA-9]|uniref:DUF2946 domain-containing protein n=1 Tax=Caballeronia sp. DA-9 TaxID=3436237 RepID=UPI003F66B7FD